MIACILALAALLAGQAETDRIEALIKHVAELKGASFIRNGVTYDAATAAKFLKGKWDTQRDEIASAEEFIDKIASKSSTTGKPYVVRLADGKEYPSREYLTEQLEKLKKGQ